MDRNFDEFPNDENGDVLWGMAERGDDLSKIREMDFSVIFPDEEDALRFAEVLLVNRQKVSLSDYDGNDEYPIEITAHVHMVPTHANITEYEGLLEECASKNNGYNDGWGCFKQE